MATDVTTYSDIVRLVDAFYDRVRDDDVLGPIFSDVARVGWATHLPKMYNFWASILFGAGDFKGNPMLVHRELALRVSGHGGRALCRSSRGRRQESSGPDRDHHAASHPHG